MTVFWEFFEKGRKLWKENEVSIYASSLAFFLFLSFLPLLLFTSTLLPYTPLSSLELRDFLIKLFPGGYEQWISGLISSIYEKTPGILSLSFLLSWWSLGKGMLALMRALNRLHGGKETKGYFRMRIAASIYSVALVFLLLLTLCFGVFGNLFFKMLLQNIPRLEEGILLLESIREIVVMIFLLLFFLGIYTLVPEKKISVKSQLPGAITATLLWWVFSYGFSFYVRVFRPFSGYGTMGTILVFLLWLYFCGCIILAGGIVSIELSKN